MAQFVYPAKGNFSTVAKNGQVNIFDRLEVTYNSTWPSLNMTLFCLRGSTSTDWYYFNVNGNPILADGTYAIQSISALNFNIFQYPTNCKVRLTKYGNNSVALDGDLFKVVSIPGTSTTYKMPATSTDGSNTRTSQTATSTPRSSATSTSTSGAHASSAPATATSAASTSSPSAASGSSSGLSVGAQAGIGVGVGILVLIIGLLIWLVFRQRRKLKQRQSQPEPTTATPPQPPEFFQNTKPELASQTVATSPSDHKHEMDTQNPRVELEAPESGAKEKPASGPHELG